MTDPKDFEIILLCLHITINNRLYRDTVDACKSNNVAQTCRDANRDSSWTYFWNRR